MTAQFQKRQPFHEKTSVTARRARFQEVETLLLRNSIEEEEEEEEEDEDISKSYITNGTHPPAPPDR